MSMIPQFAGYGGVVPGLSGSMFPNLPGFSSSRNNMGGVNTQLTLRGPAPVSPWMAPPLPGMTPATTPNVPATGTGSAPTGSRSLATHGMATTPAATPPAGTPNSATPPQANQGGWLSGLLGQITGQAFQPLPDPPTQGMTQAQANQLKYQQYLQNYANARNQQNFNWAAQALQGAGTTAKSDAETIAEQQRASNTQGVMDRGLNNSTILPTLNRGVDRDLSYNNQRIDEGIAQQLISLLQSQNITGPNTALWSQYLQQANNLPNTSLIPGYGQPAISYTSFGPRWSR